MQNVLAELEQQRDALTVTIDTLRHHLKRSHAVATRTKTKVNGFAHTTDEVRHDREGQIVESLRALQGHGTVRDIRTHLQTRSIAMSGQQIGQILMAIAKRTGQVGPRPGNFTGPRVWIATDAPAPRKAKKGKARA